jgi:hypothetical protein
VLPQDGIVFDDQHTAELLGELGFEVFDRLEELFALDGLERVSDSAHLERRAWSEPRSRGRERAASADRVERIEDREARAIRQPDIEHDRARSAPLRHGETVFGRGREQGRNSSSWPRS